MPAATSPVELSPACAMPRACPVSGHSSSRTRRGPPLDAIERGKPAGPPRRRDRGRSRRRSPARPERHATSDRRARPPPTADERHPGAAARANRPRARGPGLTDREREVLELIARGLSNEEFVATLVVSLATVKTHVNRVLTKLSLQSRAQARRDRPAGAAGAARSSPVARPSRASLAWASLAGTSGLIIQAPAGNRRRGTFAHPGDIAAAVLTYDSGRTSGNSRS